MVSAVAPWAPPATLRGGAAAAERVNPLVRGAFYLFVFSIAFEMPRRSFPLEVPTLTGLLFLLLTPLARRACYQRLPAPLLWFGGWLWMFTLSTWLNAPPYPGLLLHFLFEMALMLWLFWTGSNLLSRPQVLRAALLALVAACGLNAAMQLAGIGTVARAEWLGGERVTIFGQNANLCALILSAGILSALGLSAAPRGTGLRPAALAWSVVALIGFAVVNTGSRGGLLALGAGLLVIALGGRNGWQRFVHGTAVVFALLVLLWASFHTAVMRNRLQASVESQGNQAFAGRQRIYPALLHMVVERPLLGWGPIANQFELERRVQDLGYLRRDAHNLVLELVTSTGLIGAVPFLVGLGLCVRTAWRDRRAGAYGLLPCALLASIGVGTMSGTWIASKILWLTLAIALAAPRAHARGDQPCVA